jgi:UPF0716 protein FxsA
MLILIEVGSIIGPLATVGLVILTAICGVWLLRMEGIATLTRVQQKLQRGETPEAELLEGIMLLIGGALLLTPGFATDLLGFVCLLPGLRRPLARRIIRSASFSNFQTRTAFNQHFRHQPPNGSGSGNHKGKGNVIDGEFESSQDSSIDHDDRPKES